MPMYDDVVSRFRLHRLWALAALTELTAREVLRGHYVVLGGLVMTLALASGEAGSAVSIFAHRRVVVDTGLAAMSLLGLVTAVGVGQGIIARDLGRDGASVVLSQPLPRWVWLVARFFGVWAVLALMLGGMAALQVSYAWARGTPVSQGYGPAAAIIVLEAGVALAVSMVLACLGSRPFAAAGAVAILIAGYSLDDMVAWATTRAPEFLFAVQSCKAVLPQLSLLNLRPWAANEMRVPAATLWAAWMYGLSYLGATLFVGAAAVGRRR